METTVTKIHYDGKFTITYKLSTGESSGFRVDPAIGRLIDALPNMLEALKRTRAFFDAFIPQPSGEVEEEFAVRASRRADGAAGANVARSTSHVQHGG